MLKVRLSHLRPGEALGAPEDWDSRKFYVVGTWSLSAPRTIRLSSPPLPKMYSSYLFLFEEESQWPCRESNPRSASSNCATAYLMIFRTWLTVLVCITRSKHFALCLIFTQGLYDRFELGSHVFYSSTCADFNYLFLRGMWLLCGPWFQNVRCDFKYFYIPFYFM
jgi:hypothetical protein